MLMSPTSPTHDRHDERDGLVMAIFERLDEGGEGVVPSHLLRAALLKRLDHESVRA